MVEGVPHVKWTEEEVDRMNRIENLQYAVVGKFTYDWSNLEELRKSIPQQCDIKWDCKIASGVGKPVQLDLATINKTRPSCARVKVLVDLKREFPKFFSMDIINEATGELRTEAIQIRYDYVPKYCEECRIKGTTRRSAEFATTKMMDKGKARILSSGKVVGDPGAWKVVQNRNPSKNKVASLSTSPMVENRFEVLGKPYHDTVHESSNTRSNSNNSSLKDIKEKKFENNNQPNRAQVPASQQQNEIIKKKNEKERKFVENNELEEAPKVDFDQQEKVSDTEVTHKHDAFSMDPVFTTISTPKQIAIIDQQLFMNENKGEYNTYVNETFIKDEEIQQGEGTNDVSVTNNLEVAVHMSEVVNNKMAIMIIPEPVQIDNTNNIHISPNKVLYDIVSHSLIKGNKIDTEGSMIEAENFEDL
ncbi:hypothetical protein H5410_064587 [Solanum commersonii]|uniref:Uncharacterized protein n=1 Tax=Solanum commersonii TaxID=4109 RepID=A0A9J5VYZ3_SOLCO|nr:hypothetical protein H5410_064587 [Solanum commersonii]